MPAGKYFVLKSKLYGLSLSVKEDSSGGFPPAVLRPVNASEPHQIWYKDEATCTIRSKATDLSLCFCEPHKKVCLKSYDPHDKNLLWKLDGEVVRNISHGDMLLDTISRDAEVCCSEFNGCSSQKWEVHHLPARLFCIVSELNHKVLDVAGGDKLPGAKLQTLNMDGSKGSTKQHWYLDQFNFLRSALNDFSPNGSIKKDVTMQPFDPSNHQRCWTFSENKIFSICHEENVLSLQSPSEIAQVTVDKYDGGAHQRWDLKYIDTV